MCKAPQQHFHFKMTLERQYLDHFLLIFFTGCGTQLKAEQVHVEGPVQKIPVVPNRPQKEND